MARNDPDYITPSGDLRSIHADTYSAGIEATWPNTPQRGSVLACAVGTLEDYEQRWRAHWAVEAGKRYVIEMIQRGEAPFDALVDDPTADDIERESFVIEAIGQLAQGAPQIWYAPNFRGYVPSEENTMRMRISFLEIGVAALKGYPDLLALAQMVPSLDDWLWLRCNSCGDSDACIRLEKRTPASGTLRPLSPTGLPESDRVYESSGGRVGDLIDSINLRLGNPAPTYNPAVTAAANEDAMSDINLPAPNGGNGGSTGFVDTISTDWAATPNWIKWGFASAAVVASALAAKVLTKPKKKGRRRRKKR